VNPWLETIAVVLIALLGVVLGRLFSRLRGYYWTIGYLLPTGIIALLVTSRWLTPLAFMPPFYWIMASRARFVILSLATTMGLSTPMSRLHRKSERITVGIVMIIIVICFSILPFLVPALIKDELSKLPTLINDEGICFQSTDFTCAPAAAVTALRKLGLPAMEGEIAILARSSPVAGTLPGCLKTALQNRYGKEGLKCDYRRFSSIEQLNNGGITLVVLKDTLLTDHCVAVLDVSRDGVTIADPVIGKAQLSRVQFEKLWRFTGVVLERQSVHGI